MSKKRELECELELLQAVAEVARQYVFELERVGIADYADLKAALLDLDDLRGAADW